MGEFLLHILSDTVNHSTGYLICAGRDLGYPKAIVLDQTKWKIHSGFSCSLPWLQGCDELWVPEFFCPHLLCLFLIRWLVQEWSGLRLLLLPLLMTLSGFGKPMNACRHTRHGACSCNTHTHTHTHRFIYKQFRQSPWIYTCMCIICYRGINICMSCPICRHNPVQAQVHSTHGHTASPRSLTGPLTRRRLFLDSSGDLPCLIVSRGLSGEISDTQTDAWYLLMPDTHTRRRRWRRDGWTWTTDGQTERGGGKGGGGKKDLTEVKKKWGNMGDVAVKDKINERKFKCEEGIFRKGNLPYQVWVKDESVMRRKAQGESKEGSERRMKAWRHRAVCWSNTVCYIARR